MGLFVAPAKGEQTGTRVGPAEAGDFNSFPNHFRAKRTHDIFFNHGEQTSVFFILAVTIHRSLIDQFFQPRGIDHLVSRSCHCWPSSGCTQPHEPVTCVLLSPAPNDNARWAESH